MDQGVVSRRSPTTSWCAPSCREPFGGPWHRRQALPTPCSRTSVLPSKRSSSDWQRWSCWPACGVRGKAAWAWLPSCRRLYPRHGPDAAAPSRARPSTLGCCSRDPRYVTDALPIVVIGVAAAFSGKAQARHSEPLVGIEQAVAPVRAGRADGRPAGREWRPHHHVDGPPRAAHAGRGLRAGGDHRALAAPGAPVFGVQVPAQVSLSVSLPSLLNAVWSEQAMARPGQRLPGSSRRPDGSCPPRSGPPTS